MSETDSREDLPADPPTSNDPGGLIRALKLIVITDRRLAAPRPVEEIVEVALEAGCRAIQLRDKRASASQLLGQARTLRRLTSRHGALLFVNDRADVALAAGADGVHVGPDDLPVGPLRRAVPPSFLIGVSADDPDVARRAEREGADYIGCGTVYPTSTKDDAGEVIGAAGLAAVVRSVTIPVVGIGGITVDRVAEVARTGAAGVAVVSAVMAAADPGGTVRRVLGG